MQSEQSTVAQRLLKRRAGEFRARGPAENAMLDEFVCRLDAGWLRDDLPTLHQVPDATWAETDAYALMQLLVPLAEGDIERHDIPLRSTPQADEQWLANSEALNANLPHGMVAHVFEASILNGHDGWLYYDTVTGHDTFEQAALQLPGPWPANAKAPGHGSVRVPLEIGSTRAGTTLFHLLERGGLARWPYGSEHLALFVVTGERFVPQFGAPRTLQPPTK